MEDKQKILDKMKVLAGKHFELKKTITLMLDDLDEIELDYNKLKKIIKQN